MATTGFNWLIFIDTANDPQNPTFTKICGQRGMTSNRTTDEVDITSKCSPDNFKEFVGSLKEWSQDLDGVVELSDQGFQYAQLAWREDRTVLVQKQHPDGSSEVGLSFITDISDEAPYDDAATFTLTLKGTGPLVAVPAP